MYFKNYILQILALPSPELLIALLGIANIEIEEISLNDDKRELLELFLSKKCNKTKHFRIITIRRNLFMLIMSYVANRLILKIFYNSIAQPTTTHTCSLHLLIALLFYGSHKKIASFHQSHARL